MRYRLVLAALPLLWATEARTQILFLGSVDREVASVGESSLITLELLATPESQAERDELKERFAEVRLDVPKSQFEVVRRLRMQAMTSEVDEFDVLHLMRKFIVKPLRAGRLEIRTTELTLGENSYSASLRELTVYGTSDAVNRAKRSILPLIVQTSIRNRPERFVGYGSSFLVSDDALVTAYHVVVNARTVKAILPNGKVLSIKRIWAVDPLRDVAVLRIDPDEVRKAGLEPLEIVPRVFEHSAARSDLDPKIVFTAGWPDGVQRGQAGVLYAVDQFYDDEAIWLSSNLVRPGDSGGPLLDEDGRVIGVISYAMSGRRSNSIPLESVATSTDPRPALAMRRLHRRAEGIGQYRRESFFQHNPHATAAKVAAVVAEFEDPRERRYIGSVDPYLDELDLAVTVDPDQARLHFLQGSVYQMLGEYPEASSAYQAALEQRSHHYPAAYSLAYCQLALRSYSTAADLFGFIMDFDPYKDLALYGLAQAEIQLLDYREAIEHLTTLVNDHPNFGPGLYLLGRAYMGLGEDALAAEILVKLRMTDSGWANLMERTRTISSFRPLQRYNMPKATLRRLSEALN